MYSTNILPLINASFFRSPGLEYKDINPDSDPEDIQSFNHQQEILNSDIQVQNRL